jgi:hypothetical protein
VLERAARLYLTAFGERTVVYDDAGTDRPTAIPGRRVRLGGWVDLTLRDEQGRPELRQLDLWRGVAPVSDPLELESVRMAVVRLAAWADGAPVRVVWADLVGGVVRERMVVTGELQALTASLDERLRIVRARVSDGRATSGADCGACRFVAACPEHPTGAHASSRRGDLLPGVVTITPSALEGWHRCRRAWRDGFVLSLPGLDGDAGSHGRLLHDLLRLVHEQGACDDDGHVVDVLAGHGLGADERVRAEIARHARRCPRHADSRGNETTHARFHRKPLPLFMATARIDALWDHDGLLDAHDYKTGRRATELVGEDRQARLQAWVLAPLAARLGRRLRITFEHLAPEVLDDPDPFEPDDEDLAAIEQELCATVAAMRAETAYEGVADPLVCGWCAFRELCPDAATG